MRLNRFSWLLLLLPALLAVGLAVFSTRLGAGIGGDATIYITSARNLLAGRGLGLIGPAGEFRLLPYFAPFFSLVLSAAGLVTPNLAGFARWLNILLFGGLALLAAHTTLQVTRKSLFALAAGLLVALSPILIPVYSWAMSEPLALMLGFAGLWLAYRSLPDEKPGLLFALSALLTGLSFLTRYSSAAFIGAAALGLLLLAPGKLLRRLGRALLYGLAACLPMLPWLAASLAQTSTVSSRSLESGAGMAARLAAFWPQLAEVILSWWVPFSWIDSPPYPALANRLLPGLFLALLLGGLPVLAWLFHRRGKLALQSAGADRWAALLYLFGLVYLGTILLVYVLTYPPITIDNRMLSPLYTAAFWLLVLLAARLGDLRPGPRLARALALILLLLAAWNGWRAVRIVQQNYQTGLGYHSLAWQSSETIQALRALPADQAVVTNEVTALLYLLDRKAYTYMEIYQDQPAAAFTRYGEGSLEGDSGQTLFRQGKAYLVLFDSITAQFESIYGEQAPARVDALTTGLTLISRGADGAIYAYPQP